MGNATEPFGKMDEITITIEKPNLPNDIVVIAVNLDIQLPNVGFAHKIANRLNYLTNNTNPISLFPKRDSLNSDDYTDDATKTL